MQTIPVRTIRGIATAKRLSFPEYQFWNTRLAAPVEILVSFLSEDDERTKSDEPLSASTPLRIVLQLSYFNIRRTCSHTLY